MKDTKPEKYVGDRVDWGQLGGSEGIMRWVVRFYDKVAQDPVLSPMFPKNLGPSQDKQHAYFVEFFGGPDLYSEKYGKAFLRFKHRHFKIGVPERDAWMQLVMEALAEEGLQQDVLDKVEENLTPLADAMINHHPDKKDPYYFK